MYLSVNNNGKNLAFNLGILQEISILTRLAERDGLNTTIHPTWCSFKQSRSKAAQNKLAEVTSFSLTFISTVAIVVSRRSFKDAGEAQQSS